MHEDSKGLDFGKDDQVAIKFVEMMWGYYFLSSFILPETCSLFVIRYPYHMYSDPELQRTKNKIVEKKNETPNNSVSYLLKAGSQVRQLIKFQLQCLLAL